MPRVREVRTMTRTTFSLLFVGLMALATTAAAPQPQALTPAQIDAILVKAHRAAGGAALDRLGGEFASASVTQGGAPFTVTSVSNLRNGYSFSRAVIGPATSEQGYDGEAWTQENGAVSIVSLPALVADNVTQAYLGANLYFRPGARSTIVSGSLEEVDGSAAYVLRVVPPGGSPADLAFDAATYRLVRVVAHTAAGLDTTTFSDYENVQGVSTARKSVDVNPQGTTTTATLTSVRYVAHLAAGTVPGPPYVVTGRLAAPVSIPFLSDIVGGMGHIVVPVTLDGKSATLFFDSGGADFLIPSAAERLGFLTSGTVATGGAGSQEQSSSFARVHSVNFGGAILRNQNFIVTSLPYPLSHPRRGMMVEGLVGMEYLANFRIAVDYAQRRIAISPFSAPRPRRGVTLPFKSDGAHAYVLASVDGARGYFLLDTGNSGGVILNAPFAQQHRLLSSGADYVAPGGVGGTFPYTVARAKRFELAGVSFHDVPVSVAHTAGGIFATHGIAGNLGAGILSRFTVIFDYRAQTVTFVPNANVAKPFHSDGTGLSLGQSAPDAFDVLAVVAGSPAADAGIVAGDRVLAVNGTSVSTGLGAGDLYTLVGGRAPLTLTIERGSTTKSVTLQPRELLGSPQ